MTPSLPKPSTKPSTSQISSPAKVDNAKDATQKRETSVVAASGASDLVTGPSAHINGYTPIPNPRRILTAQENERVSKALASIDDAVFSDVETLGFDAEKKQYLEKSKKRALEVGEAETRKRKVFDQSRCYAYDTH